MMPCNPCPPFPSEEEGSQLSAWQPVAESGRGPTRCQGAREKAGENPLGEEKGEGVGRNPLEQQSPAFLVPGVGFVKQFIHVNQGRGMV